MIISRTSLRLPFFSGASDLPSFYRKEVGAAFSVTIDKYIHVCVHKTDHIGIKTMYDSVEEVTDINDMQHRITKESLKYFGISKETTLCSISDIYTQGSGLGSSSAFTVGLINALSVYKDNGVLSRKNLSEISCEIEIIRCNYPIGKQDAYASSYGGMNLFEFFPTGVVTVKPVNFVTTVALQLENNLILVYSGKGRSANAILEKQTEAIDDKIKFKLMKNGRDKAYKAIKLLDADDSDSFGDLLHQAWIDKKQTVKEITSPYFNYIYDNVISAGALGGKLLGAGGGGFFIFYVPKNKRENVIYEIKKNEDCRIYDFKFTQNGSEIVY